MILLTLIFLGGPLKSDLVLLDCNAPDTHAAVLLLHNAVTFFCSHWYTVSNTRLLYAGVYLLLKCGMLVERASLLLSSAKAVLWQEAAYGQYAKPEEVMESGNQCSICQVAQFLIPRQFAQLLHT